MASPCPACGGEHPPEAPCSSVRRREGELLADKYRVTRLLGEGGMGAVYEAQHTFVGRRFAVKFLHVDLARRSEAVARFRREAQTAGSLESEHVASVVDFGAAADGTPYLVMEYLEGRDLGRLLGSEGAIVAPRAVRLVIQACRGLEVAHAAGVVHRDLKPENLFLTTRADGSDLVKIVDFGIAKLRDTDGESARTQTGTALGTPYYMSPEQARGERAIDHRADIYAMGVILYEALSGKKPHTGETYNAIMYHLLTQPVVPLRTLRPDLSSELAAVVERAMATDPAHRYATVTELVDALAPFAGAISGAGGGALALSATVAAPSVSGPPPGTPGAIQIPTQASRAGRARGAFVPLALLGGAVLVAGVVAAALLFPWLSIRTPSPAPAKPSVVARPQPSRDLSACIVRARASSEQPRHPAMHAFDQRPSTAWNEAAPGDGTGEWVEVVLEPGTRVDYVEVGGGWSAMSEGGALDLWAHNNSFRVMKVSFDGGAREVTFDRKTDRGVKKRVELGVATTSVRFTAIAVDRGRFDDLCLDDAVLYGKPGPACAAEGPAEPPRAR